jgi:hypothetical protein
VSPDIYNDVFDDLINRNSPEAKAMRRAAIVYDKVREVCERVEGSSDDPAVMLAKEKLANAERTLYVAGLTLALKVVNR